VVNRATENASVSDFRVLSSAELLDDDDPTGGEVDPDDSPEQVEGRTVVSGCACRSEPGGSGGGAWWPWALWVLLVVRRRP
jgi:MYXO-CTERM domain-containing protein